MQACTLSVTAAAHNCVCCACCLCSAVVVLGYLHYVISMVNEICAYLKIPCLTVRKVVD
jgi:hypothetical protein